MLEHALCWSMQLSSSGQQENPLLSAMLKRHSTGIGAVQPRQVLCTDRLYLQSGLELLR